MTPLIRNLVLVIGVVALITGVVVGLLWLRGNGGAQAPAAARPGLAVLVTTRQVDGGTLLRGDDMTWRVIGAQSSPTGAFVRGTNSEIELVGALARRDLAAGEIITSTALLKSNERGFLAATLNPGFRAVTIAVDAPQIASGLVLPGDRVDVILVQTLDSSAPGRKSAGETVLRDARVVAVGRIMAAEGKAGSAAGPETSARTITLEMRPADAERLFVAGQLGKLELSLRAVGDRAVASSVPIVVWAGDVSNALGAATPSAAPRSPAKRSASAPQSGPSTEVQILRGSTSGNQ